MRLYLPKYCVLSPPFPLSGSLLSFCSCSSSRVGMWASLAMLPPRRRQELASHRLVSWGGCWPGRPPRPSVATRQPLRVCVCGSVNQRAASVSVCLRRSVFGLLQRRSLEVVKKRLGSIFNFRNLSALVRPPLTVTDGGDSLCFILRLLNCCFCQFYPGVNAMLPRVVVV